MPTAKPRGAPRSKDAGAPAPEDRTPIAHRGLVWVTADPRELDLLCADPQLGKLVAARPAPGLAAIRLADEERFTARLAKLGQVPRRVEGL